MKSNLMITGIYLYLQISSLVLTETQICQHLVINKSNKCKQKFYTENRKKLSTCVCRDMNVELTYSNSIWQTLSNLKNSSLSFDIYLKNYL